MDVNRAVLYGKVVIPIQTISFYNRRRAGFPDKFLKVVIPIQTISFYNPQKQNNYEKDISCHTYPNDKLLQHARLGYRYTF